MNWELNMSDKPVKPKPAFYAKCFETLQNIAKDNGYNLVLHGSMNRDMDLVAIPWIDEPKSHLELIHAFADFLGIHKYDKPEFYQFSILPGGRFSYVLNLFRGNKHLHVVGEGPWEEAQYYIDLSITPLVV